MLYTRDAKDAFKFQIVSVRFLRNMLSSQDTERTFAQNIIAEKYETAKRRSMTETHGMQLNGS